MKPISPLDKLVLHLKRFVLAAAVFAGSTGTARAAAVYIGDDAAEGLNVTAGGGTQADTLNPLTYAFTGTGTTYTAAAAQTITLTEVNFFADEGPGNLTPFVARYNGGNNQLGASYTVLAIGDPISVTGSTFGSAGNVLQNRAFTVSGVNPQISLGAGDVLVAGLSQSSRIVLVGSGTGSNNDYIAQANTLPSSTGQTLTGNSGFALNRTMQYNVGFNVPEPSAALLGVPVLGAVGLLGRRRRAVQR